MKPWFVKSSATLADAPVILAIRESLPWSFAVFLAALIAFIPFVQVSGHTWSELLRRLSLAELPAFGVMAFALTVLLSYRLAMQLRLRPALIAAAALLCFLVSLPRPIALGRPLEYLRVVGQTGLFVAILASVAVAYCTVFVRKRLPGWRGESLGVAAVVVFAFACAVLQISAGDVLLKMLAPMGRLGDTYTALVVVVLVETLLWCIGIHGPATLAAIVTPVYLTLQLQNTQAFAQHRLLPHIVVVSLFLFVFPGGAGATLPLAALLSISKVERLRKIGRVTLLPAIFNINEPLMFGLPIVFNPFLVVPFVLVPLVLASISYFAVAHDMVARPALYVPSSIPSLISTYLATLDPRAVALVAINIAIATVVYIPFVRAYERHEMRGAS